VFHTKSECYDPLRQEKESLARDGLKDCLAYAARDMETAIANNIQVHFFKRQFRYLRFTNSSLKPKEVYELQTRINNRPGEHHFSLPEKIIESVPYDLKKDPWKFLVPMYHMAQTLGDKFHDMEGENQPSFKGFSLLPVRRGFASRYMHVDHSSLESWVRRDI
jgi:hypothetical protein